MSSRTGTRTGACPDVPLPRPISRPHARHDTRLKVRLLAALRRAWNSTSTRIHTRGIAPATVKSDLGGLKLSTIGEGDPPRDARPLLANSRAHARLTVPFLLSSALLVCVDDRTCLRDTYHSRRGLIENGFVTTSDIARGHLRYLI